MSRDLDRPSDGDAEMPGDFASWYQSVGPDAGRRAHALERLQDAVHHAGHDSVHDTDNASGYSSDSSSRPQSPTTQRGKRRLMVAVLAGAAIAATALIAILPRARSHAPSHTSAMANAPAVPQTQRAPVTPQSVGFTLQLTDNSARNVSLAGDFNGWNAAALPMLRDASTGVWRIRIALPPGRHSYSYVIDGTRWVIDPLAPRTNEGELGPTNVINIAGES